MNYNPGLGLHPGRWRVVQDPLQFLDINAYVDIARRAESAGFDAAFLSDFQTVPREPPLEPWHTFDPLLALVAIAQATDRLGLIATVSTTFSEPYDLARRFSSLDHISNGRAAWNVVTSFLPNAAANFGGELPDPEERYARAEEFIAVAQDLWNSWDENALVADKHSGRLVDWNRVRRLDHVGKYFSVRGPLQIPRSPQGGPVIFQAGASPKGLEFAGRHAEVIYSLPNTFEHAREANLRAKQSVSDAGRDPSKVLFLPGIVPVPISTENEAEKTLELLNSYRDLASEAEQFGAKLGIELGADDLDRPLPRRETVGSTVPGSEGLAGSGWQTVERHPNATLRELLLTALGRNRFVVGTSEFIADEMDRWFSSGAADGFNVSATHFPDGLQSFIDEVVPELKKRGLVRFPEGRTLRERLGLA